MSRVPKRVALAIGTALAAAGAWADAATHGGIEIIGPAQFIQQTRSALSLLQAKAPSAYAIVSGCIGRIESGPRSGMRSHAVPPTFFVADRTAFHSLTWYAGTIAHDSMHCKLYHGYASTKGLPVPHEIFSGMAAERQCLTHQAWVLSAVGAPAREIDHVRAGDGRHFDLNGDGRYTSEDYERRNW